MHGRSVNKDAIVVVFLEFINLLSMFDWLVAKTSVAT